MTNRHIMSQPTSNLKMMNTHNKHGKTATTPVAKGMDQLVYTPSQLATSGEHHPTMVLNVDANMYKEWQKDKSIAMANVVDSFEVFKYEMGRSGMLSKPSKAELDDVFGTHNMDDVVKFMLENGSFHHKSM